METISPNSVLQDIGKSLLSNLEESERSNDIFVWLKNIINEKRQPIEFFNHCFMRQPYSDFTPVQVYKKGAQVGVTTMAFLKAFFFAQRNKIDIISIFPSATDVRKFCQGRFDAVVKRNPLLRKYMIGLDSTELKEICDSRMYFQGSWTERAALSIPADLLYIDEVDRCRPDVLEMYEDRLAASEYRWQWYLSTPTFPKFGIDVLYEKSNQYTWMVKCEHCGTWQEIRLDSIKAKLQRTPRIQTKNRDRNPDGTLQNVYSEPRKKQFYFACRKCQRELDRRNGEWVAKFQAEPVHGYYMSQLIAPWVSADFIMDKKSKSKFQKTFWNFTLGLARSEGSGILTKEVMLKCWRKEEMLGGGENYYMGVDNSDVKHIVISKTEGGIRKVVYLEKTEDSSRVGQLMHAFGVRLCFIDALPNKDFAKKLAKKFRGRVRWIYYGSFEEFGKEGKEKGSIVLNRSQVLDKTADVWITGGCVLPRLSPIVDEFMNNLCNMEREEKEDRHGQLRRHWLSVGPDHFRHTDAYAYTAEMYDKKGGFEDSMRQSPVSDVGESELVEDEDAIFAHWY